MAQADPHVKQDSAGPNTRRVLVLVLMNRCRDWIDSHPRTGWYIAGMVTLNFIVSVLQLFH